MKVSALIVKITIAFSLREKRSIAKGNRFTSNAVLGNYNVLTGHDSATLDGALDGFVLEDNSFGGDFNFGNVEDGELRDVGNNMSIANNKFFGSFQLFNGADKLDNSLNDGSYVGNIFGKNFKIGNKNWNENRR
ncbi:unnamed protein product [Oikopleura dioica]|uniref:Uncharacterized protein n=1 Tax=Oikopleura dioica TaxID=34765 RepID=E4XJ70_OIKDI|nr:unnamed protein product [Oikopleura dioica]